MNDPDFIAEATAIDDARNAAYAELRAANARGITLDDVLAMETAMADIEARCERLRRRFYPHRHKLIITLGAALTVSPTWRSRRCVWRRPRAVEESAI